MGISTCWMTSDFSSHVNLQMNDVVTKIGCMNDGTNDDASNTD